MSYIAMLFVLNVLGNNKRGFRRKVSDVGADLSMIVLKQNFEEYEGK